MRSTSYCHFIFTDKNFSTGNIFLLINIYVCAYRCSNDGSTFISPNNTTVYRLRTRVFFIADNISQNLFPMFLYRPHFYIPDAFPYGCLSLPAH